MDRGCEINELDNGPHGYGSFRPKIPRSEGIGSPLFAFSVFHQPGSFLLIRQTSPH